MTTRPPRTSGRRLHLFDLDGTLMRGSAALEISRQLGLEPEIQQLEHAFSARELTPPEFAARACALWSELTEDHVAAAFAGAPWLAGIREVWDEIRESGERCAVISLSPDFFVRLLAEEAPPGRDSAPGGATAPRSARGSGSASGSSSVPGSVSGAGPDSGTGPVSGVVQGRGADAARGSVWPSVPFRDPVDPAGILSSGAKVRIADELCAVFGVSRADCVAYGDSMSDVDLFTAVPVSVAVNADHHVRGTASYDYRGGDLREAYGLVRTHR